MIRAGFSDWLDRLRSSPCGLHGSTLVDAMVEAAHGRYFVGPSDADDALRLAESMGLIRRGDQPCPTVSQRAFAGLSHSRRGYADAARFYASQWHWWIVQ